MREILFSAKRLDNGEWVEGYYSPHPHPFSGFLKDFIFAPYYDVEKECGYDNGYQIDVETLCQYTGLTDKNGNKIWENDVVEFLSGKGIVKQECGCFGVTFRDFVDWNEIENQIISITGCNNKLCTCMNDNFISLWEIMWIFNDEENSVYTVEVIGNIFDTPELVKEGTE